jgi:hypothetical protein
MVMETVRAIEVSAGVIVAALSSFAESHAEFDSGNQ